MELTPKEQQFLQLLKEQNAYKEALTALQWDSHTQIPSGGVDSRAEVVGILSAKLQQDQTSERMKEALEEMKAVSQNRLILKAAEEARFIYDRKGKIPNDAYRRYVTLCSKAEAVWEEARRADDFGQFEPYLQQIVSCNQDFADRWGYEGHRYNALLEEHEPGMTVAVLDEVFPPLRKSVGNLLEQVKESPVKADVQLLRKEFPLDRQKSLCEAFLKKIGYRFAEGRLDTSAHPYSFAINRQDVRLSTKYVADDFRTSVFSAVHEGGHALYEQNIAQRLHGTPLSAASSMGMHESQSLYWEVFVAADRDFWETNYEWFRKFAPKEFDDIPLDEFYVALHDVKSSPIRIEADPLTYQMHIMLRYELEKGLLSGDISVGEVPDVWKELTQKYLGITPASHREGALQDIHWSSGDFGYFPSYTLGYIYGAQLQNSLKQDIPFAELLKQGDLETIRKWFTERIHQYGKTKKPLDLLESATGEELNAEYLIEFFRQKYGGIYQF